ncbi:STY4528 family pathogenicity island replication protein [Providencia rettgeri]|uniref:STY4528 family pathogenicity island replication protein n=1 Tax=Providencia rettgeri TaxID=587 RepID=UPI0024AB2429
MPTTPESILQFTLQKMRQRLQNEQQYNPSGQVRSGLVFAGNIHDAIPRQLLLDSRLSPFDKLAWIMIRLHAQQNNGAVFPTYDELQFQLATPHSHKASRETISRALLMLRLTGWLSLCHRVRDTRGRIRGNIYMLHDEPVNAFDAETLDPRWMDVLEKSCYHKNKSVRCVAQATLTTLKTDPTMRHQHTRMALIEQRLESEQTPGELADRQRRILGTRVSQTRAVKNKKNRTQCQKPGSKIELSTKKGANTPGSKIELSPQTQSGSVVRKSNCYVRNSFTQSVKNTYVSHDSENSVNTQPLIPPCLQDKLVSEEDRTMLESQLQALPGDIAASIVNQLNQGIRAGSVRNPVGYTLQLLKSAREGRYNTIPSAENKLEKPRRAKRKPESEPRTNPPEMRGRTAEVRGSQTAPEVAQKYLHGIRRALAGVTD